MTLALSASVSGSACTYRSPLRLLSALALLAFLLIACNTSPKVRLEPRFDPNIDYGQIEAGSWLRLDVDLIAQNGEPVSATGSPGFTIDWSVDGPDATGSSLRAVPGTRDSIEYRPPAGARGRVVVRAELRNEDCPGGTRAAEACSAEFPLRIVAPGPPTLLVFVGGNELGEFLLEWTGAPADAIGWEYRHRPKWDPDWPGRLGREAPWGAWSDIPGSTGDTRSYRVKGLRPGTLHVFQVRPLAATGPGMPYDPVEARGSERLMNGIPQAPLDQLLESGRAFAWDYCSFVVPDGMHVDLPWATDIGPQYSGSAGGVVLYDVKSRSSMLLNISDCEVVLQQIRVPHPPPGRRDVPQLFEQIADSFETIRFP